VGGWQFESGNIKTVSSVLIGLYNFCTEWKKTGDRNATLLWSVNGEHTRYQYKYQGGITGSRIGMKFWETLDGM